MRRFVKEYALYRLKQFEDDKRNAPTETAMIIASVRIAKCRKIVAAYEHGMITANEAMRTLSNIGYYED